MTTRPGPGTTEPGLKAILQGSKLCQPWREDGYAPLTQMQVENLALNNSADEVIVAIAGGAKEFILKTNGGVMNPTWWPFYGLLPTVWPPVVATADPYFEPINVPSNQPDKISQARAGAVTVAQLASDLAFVRASLARIEADVALIKNDRGID
jgi:hypothetical protein